MIIDSLAQTLTNLDAYCDGAYDLRGIYDNIVDPVYFDLGHPTDFGNEIIAQKFYEIALPFVMENKK